MKVKELIEALNKLNPELDVLCYSEDEALLAKGHAFRLLSIDRVDESEGERMRDENGIPALKLGKSPQSTKIALLETTADF